MPWGILRALAGEAVARAQPTAQRRLARPIPAGALLATAAVAITWGLLAGLALAATSAGARADRALSLAALAAFPAPLWLLSLLSTPPHAPCRRMLGEDARSVLAGSVRAGLSIIGISLLAPLAVAAAGLWQPAAAEDLQRGAALIACGAIGSGLWALAALAAALDRIASGLQESWRALAGGGVFGPAETAPLLYAPAFAFVVALLPAALMAALWGAKSELLPPSTAVAIALVALVAAGLAARRSLRQLRARVQAALLIVEQAHATPFALAEVHPQVPGWLASGGGRLDLPTGASYTFIARSWVRRFPASAVATLSLAALAALVLRGQSGQLAVAAACLAICAYSVTRAVDLHRIDETVSGAARWLGASRLQQRRSMQRLALSLGVPSVACLLIGAASGAWLAAGCGLAAGATAGWSLLRWARRPTLTVWTGRLLLVLALLIAAAPAPGADSGRPTKPPTEVRP